MCLMAFLVELEELGHTRKLYLSALTEAGTWLPGCRSGLTFGGEHRAVLQSTAVTGHCRNFSCDSLCFHRRFMFSSFLMQILVNVHYLSTDSMSRRKLQI